MIQVSINLRSQSGTVYDLPRTPWWTKDVDEVREKAGHRITLRKLVDVV